MVLPVLTAYLTALIELNDELNIDSDRRKGLDEAIEPKGAVFPNHKICLMAIAMAIWVFLGIWWHRKLLKTCGKGMILITGADGFINATVERLVKKAHGSCFCLLQLFNFGWILKARY